MSDGWTTEYPVDHIAIVYTFCGEVVKMPAEKVCLWRGKPERIYGGGFKHKFDEEPFMIVEPRKSDVEVLDD